jgi:predicted metal-dependent HD superfamily phosphohydrolase
MAASDPRQRFLELGERLQLPAAATASLAGELVARYREPHRRYHTLTHVFDCLDLAAGVRDELEDPDVVDLALWFHDAVYDPRAFDSEVKSAVIARERLSALGLTAVRCGRVTDLVLITALPASAPPGDPAFLCDIDFSILGRDWPEYDAYRRAIREEFAFVPDDLFTVRRGQLLGEWLARPRLFHTDTFRARYEEAARKNLERELAAYTRAP